jgi:hypothetical protein
MGMTRRFEAWHLGGLIVSWAESFPWPQDFCLACDWGKRLEIRCFAACQSYFDVLLKYIFTYSRNIVGNLPAMF